MIWTSSSAAKLKCVARSCFEEVEGTLHLGTNHCYRYISVRREVRRPSLDRLPERTHLYIAL